MKKSILALTMAGILLLTGCTAMLENRDHLSLSPYKPSSTSSIGASSYRVENYQDLLDAILSFVSAGEEHGVITMHNYNAQDVEPDLTRACLQVVQTDPLGAFLVDYIKHDYSLIVSYYEVNIHITYRHAPDRVDSIVSVTGSSAIRRELRKTLTSFASEAVLRVSYFAEDEAYIQDLVRQAYYNAPVAALGMPEVTVSLYPATGTKRIVEIDLSYPENQAFLRRRSQELKELVLSMVPQSSSAQDLYNTIIDSLTIEEGTGRNNAYDALVEGISDSEGAALAYQLLCDQTSVQSVIVEGTLDGAPHFWNIITEDGVTYRHVDLSNKLFSLTDDELTQFRLPAEEPDPLVPEPEPGTEPVETGIYEWNHSAYPSCAP